MVIRADHNLIIETTANFTTYNTVILKDVATICSDTGKIKVGDGINRWTDLPYNEGSSIGGFDVQSGTPNNLDTLVYFSSDETWHYLSRGHKDTYTNLLSESTTIFSTYLPIIELDDSTNLPSGRYKIADGSTYFASIPWISSGILIYDEFSTGIIHKSIEWNGSEWVPVDYWSKDDFPTTTASGQFLRDDLTWADCGITTPVSAVDGNIVIFNGTSGADIRDSGVASSSLITASGCPNNTFQVGTSYNGVLLKHNSGELQIRDPTDTAYADLEFATLFCEFATVRQSIYIKGLHDLTANAFGTVTLDGAIVWTQNTDGSGSGLDADLLDGHESTYFASIGSTTFATVAHTHFASAIISSTLGTPTYTTIQDWTNVVQSSGRISGGTISASGNAGCIDISALKGFVKTSDSEITTTKFFDMSATTEILLTDDTANYIYVDYNSGSPHVQVTTDRTTIRYTDQFTLGRAFRKGSDIEIMNSGINLYNRTRNAHEKWIDTFGGLSYANGLLVSATGLKPAFTSGTFYAGSNKISVDAKDYNVSGTFTYYYTTDSGSTWTTFATNTIDSLQYNNVSSGLATLSNNQYGVHWVYICNEGDMYVLYGKSSYTLTEAQAVTSPVTPLPNYLSQWAKLAAKIIVAKGASTIYSISHAWTTAFPVQNPGDHNALAGLQGGTSSEYYHLTSTEYATVQVLAANDYVRWRGYGTSDPSDPIEGDQYWNTSTPMLRIYSNGGWHNADGT